VFKAFKGSWDGADKAVRIAPMLTLPAEA